MNLWAEKLKFWNRETFEYCSGRLAGMWVFVTLWDSGIAAASYEIYFAELFHSFPSLSVSRENIFTFLWTQREEKKMWEKWNHPSGNHNFSSSQNRKKWKLFFSSAHSEPTNWMWTHENANMCRRRCFLFPQLSLPLLKFLSLLLLWLTALHCAASYNMCNIALLRDATNWCTRQTGTGKEHVIWALLLAHYCNIQSSSECNWIPQIFWKILMRNTKESRATQSTWIKYELHCWMCRQGGANCITQTVWDFQLCYREICRITFFAV